MTQKFDTKVQLLKFKVLKEVAKKAFAGNLIENLGDIAKSIIPGKEASMRCCVYKERAIVWERVKMAMGGTKTNPNVMEVIDIACDECPVGGYEVSSACRGCIAHRCENVCKRGAISFDHEQKAHIDKSKCVECGLCAKVCPFNAVVNYKRPCENACKINAISMNAVHDACIDDQKCISCGACMNQCPFGAIMDKSYILDVVDMIKKSEGGKNYKLIAVVAPAIATQFNHVPTGKVIAAIKKLGFTDVAEAAAGADLVALSEAQELAEKGFLTSSCCPAFVDFVKKKAPKLAGNISHNLSPMAAISKHIKESEPNAKIVFIGPCTAKKMEVKKPEVSPWVNCAISFEELNALFASKDIDLETMTEEDTEAASSFGRNFARCGGLSDAVKQALAEQKIDFEVKPVACDGVMACNAALLKAQAGALGGNFIEGMICSGGCIGGAACITHEARDRMLAEAHAKKGKETISRSVQNLKTKL